jgi:hypothetical protein
MNYYDRPEVSNSDLSRLKRELAGETTDPAAAYRFGRLVDYMLTEPGKVDYYTRVCGGETYTPDEMQLAEEMKLAAGRDPECAAILRAADCQKIMINPRLPFDHDPPFALPVRCKWDLWLGAWGGDIKSTTATTQSQFDEAARHFDYDRQRYFYMTIAGSDRDILVGISKVNLRVFKTRVKRGDDLWRSGRRKTLDLAFKYWCLFGDMTP